VGARDFVVTKTDIEQCVKWGKHYTAAEVHRQLPAMVRTAAIRRPHHLPSGETVMAGENLIIRPTGPDIAFVQLDDLSAEQLDRVRPAAFIIHATSRGNHQAWIAVSGVPAGKEQFKEFMRRVRKAVGGNDKSASHATRIAGTENFKVKYSPEYPTVQIIHAMPGRVMTPEKLQEIGLLADPESVKSFVADTHIGRKSGTFSSRPWPSYEKALAGAPPNKSGTGPDRSQADYWFCYLAQQWGRSMEETEQKLLEVSPKARYQAENGDPGYARITAQNAAAAVERGRQRNRA
jgi:RepB DNA-primase from phage plasmid